MSEKRRGEGVGKMNREREPNREAEKEIAREFFTNFIKEAIEDDETADFDLLMTHVGLIAAALETEILNGDMLPKNERKEENKVGVLEELKKILVQIKAEQGGIEGSEIGEEDGETHDANEANAVMEFVKEVIGTIDDVLEALK